MGIDGQAVRLEDVAVHMPDGRIAPACSDFDSSGTIRPKSTPITRPKPRHASHAPTGELNENRLGAGSA